MRSGNPQSFKAFERFRLGNSPWKMTPPPAAIATSHTVPLLLTADPNLSSVNRGLAFRACSSSHLVCIMRSGFRLGGGGGGYRLNCDSKRRVTGDSDGVGFGKGRVARDICGGLMLRTLRIRALESILVMDKDMNLRQVYSFGTND